MANEKIKMKTIWTAPAFDVFDIDNDTPNAMKR